MKLSLIALDKVLRKCNYLIYLGNYDRPTTDQPITDQKTDIRPNGEVTLPKWHSALITLMPAARTLATASGTAALGGSIIEARPTNR